MRKNVAIGLLAVACLAAILGGFLWWMGDPTAPAAGALDGQGAAVAPCGPGWRIVAGADPSKEYNELRSLAAVSTKDVWAVGTYGTEEFALPLIERWDGARWSHVPSPSIGGYSNHLHAVAAVSSGDVWTVGGSHRGTGLWRTLALHWDGEQWEVVPSPNAAAVSILNAVAAVSAHDVWAVGEYSGGSKGLGSQPLAMRWDGRAWTIVPAPRTGRGGALNAVVALSGNDAWAAGSRDDTSGPLSKPLLMRWDGRAWSVVDTPGVGTLWAMSAVSPTDIWAVGNNGPRTLTMHWDGKTWSVIPAPNPGPDGNTLNAVAALGPRDAWAAGSQNRGGGDRPLTIHWDGARWEVVPSPGATSYLDTLWAIAATGDTVWAAGSSITDAAGTNKTLIERYSHPCR